MIKRILCGVAIAAVAVGSPANASTGPGPIWNNLNSTMTKADVEALYPGQGKEHIQLTDKCKGDISFKYRDGHLYGVMIKDALEDMRTPCGSVVGLSLGKKYGAPVGEQREVFPNPPFRLTHYYKWTPADGSEVLFKLTDQMAEYFTVVYSRDDSPDASDQAASQL